MERILQKIHAIYNIKYNERKKKNTEKKVK